MRTYSLTNERNYSDNYWNGVAEATYERLNVYPGAIVNLYAATEHELHNKIAEMLNVMDLTVGEITDLGEDAEDERFEVSVKVR